MSDVKTLQSDGIPLNIKDQTARNIIATPYDPTSGTYGAGDVCINGNQGYKALVDISTPEAFDPTKWEPTTLGELYTELKSNLTYKLVDSKEGATSINLPASFKKLLVHVSDGAWVNFSIELLPSMLDSNGKYFGAGAYFSSNSYNSCLVLATTTTVTLNNLTEGGTNKTSSGVTTVYYR